MTKRDLREAIAVYRNKASAFRANGYLASADAMDATAIRYEFWLERIAQVAAEDRASSAVVV